MKCKLCGSNKVIKSKTINVNTIKESYKIDISKFFNSTEFSEYQCAQCDIKSFDGVLPGDSEFYDYLQELPMYYEDDKPEFKQAINYITQYNPLKILEIGAGRGNFLEKIKDIYNIRASEFSKKSLSYLNKKNITLDKEQDSYDFICSFQVFEHVDNLTELLDFLDKKLEKNGLVFITVPNNDSIYFQETFDILDYPPHHMHQFSKKALLNMGKALKYELVEYWIEPMRIEHFLSVIRQRRKKIMHRFKFISKIYSLIDYFLIPYFYTSELNGHTHGILLRKV